ncbi:MULTISPECIES: STAS domain-containing protein [Comamonas]|uniref:STAS domain-containing protein n=1 Tax=Comamonas flocculans TaxID=2597701 RepID=A0A5B8RVL7_9BURK|nr:MULTISPECIES: STAS domain-containing protein [Comamonas]QEA11827.1 STAS domain-containing protein [Comamonas flocculans]QXL84884.1 STAS domain-containing protein [Comamonas sp. NLF-1-9]
MLVLPSTLTHAKAGACLQLLLQGLKAEQGSQVLVDCAALSVFDSSALAVLLECRRAALYDGKQLATRAMPQPLLDLAGLYGVQELLAPAAA